MKLYFIYWNTFYSVRFLDSKVGPSKISRWLFLSPDKNSASLIRDFDNQTLCKSSPAGDCRWEVDLHDRGQILKLLKVSECSFTLNLSQKVLRWIEPFVMVIVINWFGLLTSRHIWIMLYENWSLYLSAIILGHNYRNYIIIISGH